MNEQKNLSGSNSNSSMATAQNTKMNMATATRTESEKETIKEFGASGGSFSFDTKVERSVDDIYRTPRSQAYLDIVASIDLLSATDEEIIEKLREVVDEDTLEEFAEMSIEELMEELRLSFEEEMLSRELEMKNYLEPEILLGVISKCYISGCDVHAIDKGGHILEHYREKGSLPDGMEIGRKMYYKCDGPQGGCRCIEVYSNCCRVINSDGGVVKYDLEGNKVE